MILRVPAQGARDPSYCRVRIAELDQLEKERELLLEVARAAHAGDLRTLYHRLDELPIDLLTIVMEATR